MENINDYYNGVIQRAKSDIDSKPEAYLLGVKANELVQYYVNKFQLPLIERDDSREITYEKEKAIMRRVRNMPFPIGRDIPLKIFYPIIPKARLKEVIQKQSSTYYPGYQLDFNDDSLIVTVFLKGDNVNQETKITRAIEDLEKVIGWKNSDVQNGNKRLETTLSNYISQKKKQLGADNKLIEEIIKKVPVKLQRRTTSIPKVDLSVRKEIKPVYPKAKKIEEPFIEADKVEAVVELLKSAGFSFETTPQVFSILEEEQLRDILLSQLNTVFEGEATGETFVKKGKTDIHLRIDKGSILSAECKFWDGEKNYLSMMDQLFSYLTWRQNYGILIIFSRRKSFSGIIEKAKSAALAHSTTLKNLLKMRDKSHFVTTSRLPEDPMKYVTLHHLLFNLYFE